MTADAGDELRDDRNFEDEEEAGGDRKSLWGLISLILTAVLIILILLLLRSCDISGRGGDERGSRTIEPVLGSDPVDGMLSVWISENATVSKVLRDGGVSSSGAIDMGDGHWVVSVPAGSERAGVDKLKKTAGVVDAGLVFEGGSDGAAEATSSP